MTTAPSFHNQVEQMQDASDDVFSYHARRVATFDCAEHRRDGDLPCRRFECRSCGAAILLARQAALRKAADRCRVRTHLVLTAPGHIAGNKANAAQMRKKLLRLRQAYQRHFKKPLNGVWVLGNDHDGLHFHAIIDAEITPWFKHRWTKLTGAHQIFQRSIDNPAGLVNYMLKNYVAISNRGIGRRVGGFGKAKLKFSATLRFADKFNSAEDKLLLMTVRSQLSAANELPLGGSRGLWPYPPFRAARRAARSLVHEFGRFDNWLVMPWPNLAPLRAELLSQNKTVIVPARDGSTAMQITYSEHGQRPRFAPYRGPVDIAVISCTAFSPDFPEPYALDCDRQACLFENIQEPEVGLQRNYTPLPVVCLASDAQAVHAWPRHARGCIPAHLVFTGSKIIPLDPQLKEAAEVQEHVNAD